MLILQMANKTGGNYITVFLEEGNIIIVRTLNKILFSFVFCSRYLDTS
jgi:hypothetical protein